MEIVNCSLQGSLRHTLQEVRPHALLGVPRVWEKMQEGLQDLGRNASSLRKSLAKWAKGVGLKANYAKMDG